MRSTETIISLLTRRPRAPKAMEALACQIGRDQRARVRHLLRSEGFPDIKGTASA